MLNVINSLPTEEFGTLLYVGKFWNPKTQVGRISELHVHGKSVTVKLYDRSGSDLGNFATARTAKAFLRKILFPGEE